MRYTRIVLPSTMPISRFMWMNTTTTTIIIITIIIINHHRHAFKDLGPVTRFDRTITM